MPETYGIKVSPKGFDVDTASDQQLLFTSAWPLLKIEKQGSFVVTDKTKDVVIATHDLGYTPMFMVYSSEGVNGDASQTRLQTGPPIGASETDLKWFGNYYSQPAGAVTLYYYIFKYNMTTNFDALTFNELDSKQIIDQNYGIKITKPGKNYSSTDLRDFVVHSDARSLQIQKTYHKTEASGPWDEIIPHGLNYEPFFLWYQKDTYTYGGGVHTNYWELIGASDQERYGWADAVNINLGSLSKGDLFVIIFKDPFALTE